MLLLVCPQERMRSFGRRMAAAATRVRVNGRGVASGQWFRARRVKATPIVPHELLVEAGGGYQCDD